MAKEKFERTKPHVNVGTIGHVDHGNEGVISSNLIVGSCRCRFDGFFLKLII